MSFEGTPFLFERNHRHSPQKKTRQMGVHATVGAPHIRLDQDVPGLDAAALLGLLDHALGDAVLGGTWSQTLPAKPMGES